MIRQIVIALACCAATTVSNVALAQDQEAPETPAGQQGAVSAAPLWLMSCSNQVQPEQLLCEFSQSIVLTQGNQTQRVATASFSRIAGESETNTLFTLPYGVSLPDPVTVLVDEQKMGTLAWESCDLGGCYATGEVTDAWLEGMRKGETLIAAFKSRDGRDLNFSFQLNGFTKAEAMLP